MACHLERRYLDMKACVAITSYFGLSLKCKKQFLEKKIASFWVTNGTSKIKLLNDQVVLLLMKLICRH